LGAAGGEGLVKDIGNFMVEIFAFRKMRIWILLLIGILVPGVSWVGAWDVEVTAQLDRSVVEMGDTLTLNLQIDPSDDLESIELPKLEGFEVVGQSHQISLRIEGMKSQKAVVYNYFLLPLQTGQFRIPAIPVKVKGKVYTTNPLDIEVIPASGGGSSSNPPSSANSANASDDTSLEEALANSVFLVLQPELHEAYLGQDIPVTIKLYISKFSYEPPQTEPELEHTGFLMDDFTTTRAKREQLAGQEYVVMTYKTHVYPTRTGELILGPARIPLTLYFRIKSNRRPLFGDLDRFFGQDHPFGDDPFDSFFDEVVTKVIPLESTAFAIAVSPLPTEGQPKNFSGGVGALSFEISAAPGELAVGDPITVRTVVSGEGNFAAIEMPSYGHGLKEDEQFKYYEPKITLEKDRKILEQVLIPKTVDIQQLPALSFSYFDPKKAEYVTVTKGPVPLKVNPAKEESGNAVVGMTPAPTSSVSRPVTQESLGQDVAFIKDRPGRWVHHNVYLFQKPLFLVVLSLYAIIWLGLVMMLQIKQRLQTDVRLAKRLKAPRMARRGIGKARTLLEKGEQRQFYDLIFKTLQAYLGHKYHLPLGTLTWDRIKSLVGSKTMDNGLMQELEDIFSVCEMVRYASMELDRDKMQHMLVRMEKVIDRLERIK
jgi:hypothetical protein